MMFSFTAPDGWEMPPDAKPGQPFQAVGTFVADEDGNIKFTEIDGTPLADNEADEEAMEDEEKMEAPVDQMEAMMERAKSAGVLPK